MKILSVDRVGGGDAQGRVCSAGVCLLCVDLQNKTPQLDA